MFHRGFRKAVRFGILNTTLYRTVSSVSVFFLSFPPLVFPFFLNFNFNSVEHSKNGILFFGFSFYKGSSKLYAPLFGYRYSIGTIATYVSSWSNYLKGKNKSCSWLELIELPWTTSITFRIEYTYTYRNNRKKKEVRGKKKNRIRRSLRNYP